MSALVVTEQPSLSATRTRDIDGGSVDSQKNGGFREQTLSQLRGQQVHIPDLGKMMQGWQNDQSPHRDAVDGKILEIIQRHSINETVRQRLTKAMLSDQLSGWYPYAPRQRIEALTSFQAWMFIIDDMIDQYSLEHNFDFEALNTLFADCIDYIKRSLGLLPEGENQAIKYRDHDAVVSFAEYAGVVSQAYSENREYRARLAKEAIATLEGYRQEAMNRRAGRAPSLEEYLGYRVESSCMMQVVENFEFGNGLNVPEQVMTSPEMRELYRATVAVVWIINDIVSMRKEVKEGFVENLVVLLAHGNAQRGLDAAVSRVQNEIAAVNQAADAAIKSFADTPHGENVALLAKNCKNMCMANWLWSMRTPRYCLWDIPPDAEGGYTFTIDEKTNN
ncbi:hypothetical protein HIM_08259 [Hirsutella minnesotensis 3608]|uniref:Terpene synthase n=1 Tax=Hirsutella minnesotensis 3608 TaxID=1043627 RepID=A0A0F7ZT17_9HYPO|nr:hypothetical protein HIM_08259 [Hirsutella minnesotensis 3608]